MSQQMTPAHDDGAALPLDLLSTLQKTAEICVYHAPYIAVVADGKGRIIQGCCNHWDCPRCKHTLAAYHRQRMAQGAAQLMADGPLYFWTVTCRGKELDLETADDNYYLWVNRLLANLRYHAKKEGSRWCYVQVTERQERGAAHSHFIHTYCPQDGIRTKDSKGRIHIVSERFTVANVAAELGHQCRISEVESPEACAIYISGYLQKQLSADVWPKHWKRVRYSRNFPELTAAKAEICRPLLTREHWHELDQMSYAFECANEVDYQIAAHRMHNCTRAS